MDERVRVKWVHQWISSGDPDGSNDQTFREVFKSFNFKYPQTQSLWRSLVLKSDEAQILKEALKNGQRIKVTVGPAGKGLNSWSTSRSLALGFQTPSDDSEKMTGVTIQADIPGSEIVATIADLAEYYSALDRAIYTEDGPISDVLWIAYQDEKEVIVDLDTIEAEIQTAVFGGGKRANKVAAVTTDDESFTVEGIKSTWNRIPKGASDDLEVVTKDPVRANLVKEWLSWPVPKHMDAYLKAFHSFNLNYPSQVLWRGLLIPTKDLRIIEEAMRNGTKVQIKVGKGGRALNSWSQDEVVAKSFSDLQENSYHYQPDPNMTSAWISARIPGQAILADIPGLIKFYSQPEYNHVQVGDSQKIFMHDYLGAFAEEQEFWVDLGEVTSVESFNYTGQVKTAKRASLREDVKITAEWFSGDYMWKPAGEEVVKALRSWGLEYPTTTLYRWCWLSAEDVNALRKGLEEGCIIEVRTSRADTKVQSWSGNKASAAEFGREIGGGRLPEGYEQVIVTSDIPGESILLGAHDLKEYLLELYKDPDTQAWAQLGSHGPDLLSAVRTFTGGIFDQDEYIVKIEKAKVKDVAWDKGIGNWIDLEKNASVLVQDAAWLDPKGELHFLERNQEHIDFAANYIRRHPEENFKGLGADPLDTLLAKGWVRLANYGLTSILQTVRWRQSTLEMVQDVLQKHPSLKNDSIDIEIGTNYLRIDTSEFLSWNRYTEFYKANGTHHIAGQKLIKVALEPRDAELAQMWFEGDFMGETGRFDSITNMTNVERELISSLRKWGFRYGNTDLYRWCHLTEREGKKVQEALAAGDKVEVKTTFHKSGIQSWTGDFKKAEEFGKVIGEKPEKGRVAVVITAEVPGAAILIRAMDMLAKLESGLPSDQEEWTYLLNVLRLYNKGRYDQDEYVVAHKGKMPVKALSMDNNGVKAGIKEAGLKEDMAEAAKITNTEPTQGQIESGNYRKGRFIWNGLEIVIENPEGSVRSGIDSDGKSWETKMQNHYGYIRIPS
jgi:hypothetical protein